MRNTNLSSEINSSSPVIEIESDIKMENISRYSNFENDPDKAFTMVEQLLSKYEEKEILKHFKFLLSFISDSKMKNYICNCFFYLLKYKHFTTQEVEDRLGVFLDYIDEHLNDENTDKKYLAASLFSCHEINYLILLLFAKKVYRENSFILFYNNKVDSEKLIEDSLILLKLSPHISYLRLFVDFITKFNLKTKTRDIQSIFTELANKLLSLDYNNIFIMQSEFILDIIFFFFKFIFSPRNSRLYSDYNIKINNFTLLAKRLFQAYFEYLIINYKDNEKLINGKINNFVHFDNYLTFVAASNMVINENKFCFDNGFDYHTYFPHILDFYNYMFSCLLSKLSDKFSEFLFCLRHIDNYTLQKFEVFYFPPYLLRTMNESLKDFLINHLIYSNLSDNNFEVTSKGMWLHPIIICFIISDLIEKFYKIILEKINFSIEEKKSEQFSIFDKIANLIISSYDKLKIILPKKLILIRDICSLSFLYITQIIIKELPLIAKIFLENKLFTELLKEMSTRQNKHYFILCNNILKLILQDEHTYKLRVYGFHSFPLDYHEISQVKKGDLNLMDITSSANNIVVKSNHSKNNININLNVSMETDLNKENVIIDENINISNFNNMIIDVKTSVKSENNNNHNHNINEVQSKRRRKSKKKEGELIISGNNYNIIDSRFSNNSNTSNKLIKTKSSLIKFDITSIIQNFDQEQFQKMESESNCKLVSLSKNNNDKFLIKAKQLFACLVIIQKGELEIIKDTVLKPYKLVDLFNSELLINKNDLDILLTINHDNILSANQNYDNSLQNYYNTFKYLDIKEELDNDLIVSNLINLFE